MSKLQPSDILSDVESVLRSCNKGKGSDPTYMTAYQILDRLPDAVRTVLVQDHGGVGKGGGVQYGAASAVATACKMLYDAGTVDISYLDTGGIEIRRGGATVEPSGGVCGIYRIRK